MCSNLILLKAVKLLYEVFIKRVFVKNDTIKMENELFSNQFSLHFIIASNTGATPEMYHRCIIDVSTVYHRCFILYMT
jgi:hypothetical protein